MSQPLCRMTRITFWICQANMPKSASSQSDATRPLDDTSEGIAVENGAVPRQRLP